MAYKHKYVSFKLLFELLSYFTMTNYLRRSISSNLFSLLMHVRRKRSEQPEIEEIGVPEIRQTKTQLRDGPLVVEEFNWQRRECLFQNRISLPLICRPWMLQSSQRMRLMSKAGMASMQVQKRKTQSVCCFFLVWDIRSRYKYPKHIHWGRNGNLYVLIRIPKNA